MVSPVFTSSSAVFRRTAPHLWTAAFLAALVLVLPQAAVAHDIPNDVTVQAFVKPAGEHLNLLLRVHSYVAGGADGASGRIPARGGNRVDCECDRSLRR